MMSEKKISLLWSYAGWFNMALAVINIVLIYYLLELKSLVPIILFCNVLIGTVGAWISFKMGGLFNELDQTDIGPDIRD